MNTHAMMLTRRMVSMIALVISLGIATAILLRSLAAADEKGVKITETDGKVRVEIGGKLFTEYCYKDTPRPYFHPVIGATGEAISRDWPMKDTAGDAKDHPHHRSLWYAHGDLNGMDFWSDNPKAGKTVHDGFTKIASGEKSGVIATKDKWVAQSGETVCTDEREMTFQSAPDGKGVIMDFNITLKAPADKPLTLGDTKEGSMAMRLKTTMQLLKPGTGHIVNSEGVKDKDTWGKRAAWCDYYGPIADKISGVAIFDHPSNPRYPTWWHVRDYGLFAANPYGQHDFEKKEKGTGDLKVAAGGSVTFRYRFYFHEGDAAQGKVAERYNEYKVPLRN
ncbi:MAG: PmoA family protein [Candidatus Sumerlaeota bacterium]|nr:PmoA family protein [Candidatus Sumerlaeota bacterium]